MRAECVVERFGINFWSENLIKTRPGVVLSKERARETGPHSFVWGLQREWCPNGGRKKVSKPRYGWRCKKVSCSRWSEDNLTRWWILVVPFSECAEKT
jgi:hypothetical protein